MSSQAPTQASRPDSPTSAFRFDAGAFINSIMGFGVSGKDKLEEFVLRARGGWLSAQSLWDLYETNNFIGNLVDALPDASTKKFAVYECDDDDHNDLIKKALSDIKPHVNEAWKMARLHGWSVIILYVNDGVLDYSLPLNENNIRSIEGFDVRVGGRTGEVTLGKINMNPLSKDYGKVETVMFNGKDIHVSRCLFFYGVKTLGSLRMRTRAQLGTSVVQRAYKEFRNFDVANDAIAQTLPDFSLDVLKIKQLQQKISNKGEWQKYIAGMAYAKSVLNMLLIDMDDSEYNSASRSYQNLDKVLEYIKGIFAGACDIPHTILFNESPGGSTSGKHEEKTWSSYVNTQQELYLLPELTRYIDLVCKANKIKPENASLEFPSCMSLDAQDEVEVLFKKSQAFRMLTDGRIATPIDAAKALKRNVDIGKVIDIDELIRELEEMKQAMEFSQEGAINVPGQKPYIGNSEQSAKPSVSRQEGR